MRIVCWQAILMKYHTLFFQKLGKISHKLSSAAVVIGALRVKRAKLTYIATNTRLALWLPSNFHTFVVVSGFFFYFLKLLFKILFQEHSPVSNNLGAYQKIYSKFQNYGQIVSNDRSQ